MNIKTIFQRIKQRFHPTPALQDEVVVRFFKLLEKVRKEDLPCDKMYTQLDEFVEREVKAQDATKLMPLIQEHLDCCSDCHEEYEALLDVLKHTENDK
ncbi:MAG: hypothetical protein IT310_08515 [Anaerolineales bacterium]|nr:hypothetical protein [Anaerolineales bacterium]